MNLKIIYDVAWVFPETKTSCWGKLLYILSSELFSKVKNDIKKIEIKKAEYYCYSVGLGSTENFH